MNIIILSPHFPSNLTHFCTKLYEKGVNVLGLDQVPYQYLNSALKASLKDYYQVSDLHNYDELKEAVHYFLNRHGKIDAIESHNEYWLETQSHLASDFQIPGLKIEHIADMKRKSQMKKIFRNAGLHVAQGAVVHSLHEAQELANTVGYPVILKPDIGVGANGCFKIRSEKELYDFFQSKPVQDYIMEEFIEGTIFTFDGVVDQNGEIVFCTSHQYGSGVAEVVQELLDPVYHSLRTIPEDLEEAGCKILEAYKIQNRFFHFEFFRTSQKLIPIEVNMRPPGGPTVDMCNFACDINLYQLWADIMAGVDTNFSYVRKYHCMSISRRFKNSYAFSHDQILEIAPSLIVAHDTLPSLFSACMGDSYYLARSRDLDELFELQRLIQKTV